MADEHPEIELTLIVEKIKKFKKGGSDANESPVAGGVKASFQGGIYPPIPYLEDDLKQFGE